MQVTIIICNLLHFFRGGVGHKCSSFPAAVAVSERGKRAGDVEGNEGGEILVTTLS